MFDVKIYRAQSTYQFTDRFLLRNIMEYNTFSRKVGANVLFTYRVNSGTVFFIGYDARYQQGALLLDPDNDPWRHRRARLCTSDWEPLWIEVEAAAGQCGTSDVFGFELTAAEMATLAALTS